VKNPPESHARRFVVHFMTNIDESQKKLRELQDQNFNIVGIEVSPAVVSKVPLSFNIVHSNGAPACVVAFEFKNIFQRNAFIIQKPDLDSLMTVAIFRKICYREMFDEHSLAKIDLIARYDTGQQLESEEQEVINRLMGAVNQTRLYDRWKVPYNWLNGELQLNDYQPAQKQVRQVLIEKFGNIIALISFGSGIFSRRHFQSFKYMLALNPDFPFLQGRGRRYCISSKENLEELALALEELDPGWGGHDNIVCSSPLRPSRVELIEIVKLIQKLEEDQDERKIA